MADYSFETIGYFSVINGVLEEPIYKTLNIAAIKKMNHDGIPLDCNRQMPIAKNKDTVAHLYEFLLTKQLINTKPGVQEFNVISQASSLLKLLAVDWQHKEPKRFEFFDADIPNTYVIEEYIGDVVEDDEKVQLTHQSEAVERLLALLPNGTREKTARLYPLFIVVQHKYSFPNGTIINLFISKEIHSVMRHGQVFTPVDLKYNVSYMVSTPLFLERYLWKSFVMSFLAGSSSHLIAVPKHKEEYQVDRLVLFDDKTALCNPKILYEFDRRLQRLLRTLAESKCSGMLEKLSGMPQYIMIATEEHESWNRLFEAAPTYVVFEKNIRDPQKADHELVIIGSCQNPISFHNHFYNADFISLKHFHQAMFVDFLKKPKYMKFYGTIEEFYEIQNVLTDEQFSQLTFVDQ